MGRGMTLLCVVFAFMGISCERHVMTVMPLGDSLTEGLTVVQGVHTLNGGYRRHLEELLTAQKIDFDFVGSQTDSDAVPTIHKKHEGHSGWRIQDIDSQIDYWVAPTKPDVILLLLGGNDILKQNDLPNAPERFSKLLDHIRQDDPDVWIFASSILPMHDEGMNAQIATYNAGIADLVLLRQQNGEKIRWVDIYRDSGVTNSADDLPDGIHPNTTGYDKMAEVWFAAMKDFLPNS